MEARELTSVEGAISLILGDASEFGKLFEHDLALSPIWFRGHSDARWRLEPGILRRDASGQGLFDEYNMLGEMRLMRPLDIQTYPTTFDWLVMCQHYGLPTRLLDWSESILVALFFAVDNDEVDGALFALNPFRLNWRTTFARNSSLCLPTFADAILRADQSVCGSMDEVLDRVSAGFGQLATLSKYIESRGGQKRLREVAHLPVAVYPPRNNPRITQQSGMFTLHGGAVPSSRGGGRDYGEAIPLEDVDVATGFLIKFIIPAESKRRIRIDLARLGIHQGALFPEFESQAHYLRDKWTRDASRSRPSEPPRDAGPEMLE